MSAESNMVRPASRQMSTSRVASATSLAPHALNSSPPPPKVPVPKLRTGTFRPEPPSCLYSIATPSLLLSKQPEHISSRGGPGPFERRIVGVTFRPRRVERRRVGLVQRGAGRQPIREVRVRDEEHPERDRVRVAPRQHLPGRLVGEPL